MRALIVERYVKTGHKHQDGRVHGAECWSCGRTDARVRPTGGRRTHTLCRACVEERDGAVPAAGRDTNRFVPPIYLGVENESMQPCNGLDTLTHNAFVELRRSAVRDSGMAPEVQRLFDHKYDGSVLADHPEPADVDPSSVCEDCVDYEACECREDGDYCGYAWDSAQEDGGGQVDGVESVVGPFTSNAYYESVIDLHPLVVGADTGSWGCDAPNVGTHIHVWRGNLTRLHLLKMLRFFGNPDNAKWLELVAGREPNNYCESWADPEDFNPYRSNERRRSHLMYWCDFNHGTKYMQLGLRDNTVEFRLFQAAEDVKTMRGYVEFVLAFVDWTRTSSLTSNSWEDFTTWLDEQPGEGARANRKRWQMYPYLSKLITDRAEW